MLLDAILSGGRVADDVLRGANGKPRQTPRLTVAARTTIFYQVALALQYLHAERVLHHDLKPGNILLDRDFTAKVSDFGLAQLVADTEDVVSKGPTKAPRRMSAGATAVYAAPEMLLKLRGRFKDRPDRGENSFGLHERYVGFGPSSSGQLRRIVEAGCVCLRDRVCGRLFTTGRPVPFLCDECPFASSAGGGHRGCCQRPRVEAPGPRRLTGRTQAAHGAVLGDATGPIGRRSARSRGA